VESGDRGEFTLDENQRYSSLLRNTRVLLYFIIEEKSVPNISKIEGICHLNINFLKEPIL
jgi:hypothetical protein